jgi:choline monooxygenase
MTLPRLDIDADIRRARTPPGWLYAAGVHEALVERVLAASWQLVPEAAHVRPPTRAVPFTLLPGSLDEPLLLLGGDDGVLRCVSNVCTHRANLLLDAPSRGASVRCGYHGRTFDLTGRCLHMPEFAGVEGFPSRDDDLRALAVERWGPLTFVALRACPRLEQHLGALRERLAVLPFEGMRLDVDGVRTYEFDANWLLYVENYLEGFHIPFVHPALSAAVDFKSYATVLCERASVQVAEATGDGPCFAPPRDHEDHGRRIAAYYAWLWPNTMLNVYPWGCSVNVVQPLGPARTRVLFLPFVAEASLRGRGAGSGLDTVELEDEAIVQRVQRGVRARLYDRGRYSPARETGVHHFHRLLAAALRG